MLVLTIQKRDIAQKMLQGGYKANYWKSEYSCLSPRFSRGYAIMKEKLEDRVGSVLSESDSPIWVWVGVPFIDFHKGENEDDLVALFLEIPSSEMVFSDYDKYCSYVSGKSDSMDFMVDSEVVLQKSKKGNCIQACVSQVKPEHVLLTVDYTNIKKDKMSTVEKFYKHWRLISVYQNLLDKRSATVM